MRDRVYVILLFVMIMLAMSIVCSSCRTPKPSVTTVTEYDSVFVEKLVPYPLPEDTARIRALLECDENGKVVFLLVRTNRWVKCLTLLITRNASLICLNMQMTFQ